MKRYVIGILLVGFFCLASHPILATDETTAGIKAAQEWIVLVDTGAYAQSWDAAAALFKKAVKKETWVQSLQAIRPAMGKMISRRIESYDYTTSLPGAPDGEYVVIRFHSSFTHKKSAIETITPMKDPDGNWRVSGYYIK